MQETRGGRKEGDQGQGLGVVMRVGGGNVARARMGMEAVADWDSAAQKFMRQQAKQALSELEGSLRYVPTFSFSTTHCVYTNVV